MKILQIPSRFTLLPLAAMVSFVLTPFTVISEEIADAEYETVSVTGTRAAREINEIAANVTSIGAQRVDALAANNLRDILRYEAGVGVEGSGRFGLSNINIRGINGDRVLMLVDEVPISDEFSFGPNLSSRRDFVDVDLIKEVQIIRGPASTLYGSDAIGGVVSFTTKDPQDFVQQDESFAGRVKLGYVSQSNERYVNSQLAGVAGDWQWLLNAGYRDSSETDTFFTDGSDQGPDQGSDQGSNEGSDQRTANPQDSTVENGLFKLIWSPDNAHRLVMVAETFSGDTDTNITSDIGNVSLGTLTTASTGKDERERDRVSVQYRYQPQSQHSDGIKLQRIAFNAFSQSTETTQYSAFSRLSLGEVPIASTRTRDSFFEQDIQGGLAQVDFQFSGDEILGIEGWGDHYLIAGIEWQDTDSGSLREGLTVNAQTGAVIPEFSVFPARDFPLSNLQEYAFYIQDEIQLMNKALTLSPGLRYDKFELEAETDTIFASANPGVEISGYDDSETSLKLGAVYDVSDQQSFWLQWAEGFRIPPMDDVNIGFTNFAGGYTSLANPDLRPERVDSIELGWRQSVDTLSWSISVYQNDYQDFIESLAVRGFNPQTNLLEFQARNIDDVEIRGLDLSVNWQYQRWQVRFAGSWQSSENKATGEELDSVLPTQTILGVQYGDASDPWRVELVGTRVGEANAFDTVAGQPAPFIAPSVTYLDLLAHYEISEDIRINGGIFNITDKQFWYASEVRGRNVDENLDRFTAPGRNMSINVVVNF